MYEKDKKVLESGKLKTWYRPQILRGARKHTTLYDFIEIETQGAPLSICCVQVPLRLLVEVDPRPRRVEIAQQDLHR